MGDDVLVNPGLDRATVTLGKELLLIKSSLDCYCVIGLNASKVGLGQVALGHLQRLSLLEVALGLAKVFEREEDGGYELCSVSGVWRLAKATPVEEIVPLHAFAAMYGVAPQDDWIGEIDTVFTKQRSQVARHMPLITKARNTQIAHLQQEVEACDLPSVNAFQGLLRFAVHFHAFIDRAFLHTHAHPILTDTTVANSLCAVLKLAGVDDVVTDFPD